MSLSGYQAVRRAIEGHVAHGKVIYTDAYELAVQYGFEGTVEEWLATIKGDPGYTPQKGVDYFDGVNGDKGEKGDPGQSIHYCAYSDELYPNGGLMEPKGYLFPKGTPKVNDLFVTRSGYVGILTSVKTVTFYGTTYDDIMYSLVADLNGENGKSAYDYAIEAGFEGSKEEFAQQMVNPYSTAITDDGDGNVVISVLGTVFASDDGQGNVVLT